MPQDIRERLVQKLKAILPNKCCTMDTKAKEEKRKQQEKSQKRRGKKVKDDNEDNFHSSHCIDYNQFSVEVSITFFILFFF